MPIYEYSCPKCGKIFEEWIRSSSDAELEQVCPECGTASPRMLSNTSFILKGEGWFASSYGHGTSNVFDKSNGVPAPGSKPSEESSSPTVKAEPAPAASPSSTGASAKA